MNEFILIHRKCLKFLSKRDNLSNVFCFTHNQLNFNIISCKFLGHVIPFVAKLHIFHPLWI